MPEQLPVFILDSAPNAWSMSTTYLFNDYSAKAVSDEHDRSMFCVRILEVALPSDKPIMPGDLAKAISHTVCRSTLISRRSSSPSAQAVMAVPFLCQFDL